MPDQTIPNPTQLEDLVPPSTRDWVKALLNEHTRITEPVIANFTATAEGIQAQLKDLKAAVATQDNELQSLVTSLKSQLNLLDRTKATKLALIRFAQANGIELD